MLVRSASLLVDLLRARATADAEALAFVVAGGGSLTFRSWDVRSDALCRGLLAGGVAPGDRVVLSFDARRWIDYAVTYAGVHKAGAIPVLLGPQAPESALVRVAAQSGASATVTSSAELEAGQAGERVPSAPPSEVAHISYRFSPLQAFHPTSHPIREVLSSLAKVDAAMPAAGETPLLHAFDPASEGGSRALWAALGRRCGPVTVLPTFDPQLLCSLTAPYGAAVWSLAPATAGWLLDSGAMESHDLASVIRLVLLDGRASPAFLSRLTANLPEAAVVTMAPVAGERSEVAASTEDDVPVAFSQEGMLWHEVFSPGSQNLPPLVRRYRGALDVAALDRALAEIVRRHEPLRTTFEVRRGRLIQVVHSAATPPLDVLDLAGLAPEARDAEVATLLASAGRPFDLVCGPLFEARLVRLDPHDHLVILRVHHSVFDDWSVGVFRRELSALYRAFAAGEPSPLADLPLSFSQFSRAQHRRMAGPAGTAELDWWKHHLAGAPLSLQLPIEDPDRPEGAPQVSAEPVSIDLPVELSTQLRALARRERTTLFMTMLAAFEVLVQRITGQTDLLAASVVANRNRVELEAMIGGFTKKVLVRLDGSGDPTFTELLPRVRTAMMGALAHQDLPFEAVLQGVLGARAAVHGLVPQVAVMFQGVTPQTEEVVLPGLMTSGYDTSATTTRTHFSAGHDDEGPQADTVPWGAGLYLGTFLILSVVEGGGGISLAARGAFHRPSVERLLATFETLLVDIVTHPTRRLSELRLLADDERAVLMDRGGTQPDASAGRVHERELVGRAADLVDLRGFQVNRARISAALQRCPDVAEADVFLHHDLAGEPQLVTRVVPVEGKEAPDLAQLQLELWARLPGYAWPAAMMVVEHLDEVGTVPADAFSQPAAGSGASPEAHLLAELWAKARGGERRDVSENYWQSFSFLDAVGRARSVGVAVSDPHINRNRTIATLARASAAERRRRENDGDT